MGTVVRSSFRLASMRGAARIVALALCVAGPRPLRSQRYSFQYYDQEAGLQNPAPLCLLQDRAGFLWVGTQDGLFRYDGRRFRAYARSDGLPGTLVYSLHETPDGTLWVGTASGLARRVGDRFELAYPGLDGSAIFLGAMASDVRGRLYVATTKGLLIGNPDKIQPSGMRFEMFLNEGRTPAVRG